MWDSDPDFIEYVSPEKPGPSGHQGDKKPKSSGAVKSYATTSKKSDPIRATALPSTSSAPTSSDASTSVLILPEFARAAWTSRFLPTLYHRFGSSNKPWKMFTKGSEMLSIIQEVINAVYPDINYRAKWGDRICSVVRSLFFLLKNIFSSPYSR